MTLPAAAARAPAANLSIDSRYTRCRQQSIDICCMRPSSSANQPCVAAVVDRRDRRFVSQFSQIKVMMMMTMMMMRLTDRRTDGRTPDRYIDPRTAYCAGSVSCACDYVFYILCAQFVFSLLYLGLHVLLLAVVNYRHLILLNS